MTFNKETRKGVNNNSPFFLLFCSSSAQLPNADQGRLVAEVFRSHPTTPSLPVRLLWTRDRPDAGTYTWQETGTHAPGGIQTRSPSKQTLALDLSTPVIGVPGNTGDIKSQKFWFSSNNH